MLNLFFSNREVDFLRGLGGRKKEKISQKIEKEIEEAVIFAKKSPFPGKTALTKDVFSF